MKWKLSLWTNPELKFCRKLLLKNSKSHSWCFSWWFFVENRYNLVQGHKKTHSLIWVRGPTPCHSHNSVSWNHGIYAILWKCMTRFPILHIFAYAFGIQFDYFEKKIPIRNMGSREDQKPANLLFCDSGLRRIIKVYEEFILFCSRLILIRFLIAF